MGWIVTLIAGAGGSAELPDIAAEIARALEAKGKPDWLAPGTACDLAIESIPPAMAERAARDAIGEGAIDVVVQPQEGRRKQLLVADLESTIIENEMLDELADFVGLRPHVAEITRRAMNGELDFATALRERVAMIAGLPVEALAATLARTELTAGAVALVRTMRAAGAHTALVSGGFRYFTRAIAARCGFDEEAANDLVVADGRLTGAVVEPILTRDTKLETLRRLAAARGLAPDDTLAVGDGANDLPMLVAAGLGVAFRAKPIVATAAGCRVDHGDLTALLYIQGYRQAELVT